MEINANFECGNIIVEKFNDTEAELSIRPDSGAKFYQWFYFKVTGAPNAQRTFKIINASGASYPRAWNGYHALASHDDKDWFRVPTDYNGTSLIITHAAKESTTSYAFFVPYLSSHREALLRDCETSPLVSRRSIGKSVQGWSLDLIVVGDERRPVKKIWVISRQHAGEPMAEWATEGILRQLINPDDPVARSILAKATFFVVPNLNPDGTALGNLRANANGVDLNRAWDKPSDKCPEIGAALQAIQNSGVDFLFDMHGDEERPFIWLSHPSVEQNPALQQIQRQFETELGKRESSLGPAPQSIVSETGGEPGMSSNYFTKHFNCPVWIVELPFKEPEGAPSGSLLAEGCMRVGRACIDVLNTLLT